MGLFFFAGKLWSSTTCFPSCVHSLIKQDDLSLTSNLSLSGIKKTVYSPPQTPPSLRRRMAPPQAPSRPQGRSTGPGVDCC